MAIRSTYCSLQGSGSTHSADTRQLITVNQLQGLWRLCLPRYIYVTLISHRIYYHDFSKPVNF